MMMKKYKLGELIELVEETNSRGMYGPKDVRGMTITKEIIPTKADVANTDLRKFLVVHPDEFVFNPRTHGKKIGFGYNNSKKCFLISWNNIAFRVKSDALNTVIPSYLFLHFNRKEWDREACFCSWGSSTEVFSWEALCDMKLTLPSIEQQRKYVDVYLALQNNLAAYQSKVEELKLVCDGYIEELRRKMPVEKIGLYIRPCDERNSDLKIKLAQGITNDKEFATPKQVAEAETSAKIVRKGQFAYNRATTRNGEKISIAYRTGEDCVVSSAYQIFEISAKDKLYPEYLMMWYKRSEFDRYARYMSKGSAHEFFEYEDMEDVQIPIPSFETQKAIASIYNVYKERQRIAEALKEQLKNICPVLIRGSLME
ncbi:MAG: restriction endonuclease subunit S [Bacteroidales bacterium]|nr:restriction endonuclease subunit S [Bacteroidales bacterium]MDY5738332.1 restriction endonuclease subunit S [Candidatus Onthomorpha sp.]